MDRGCFFGTFAQNLPLIIKTPGGVLLWGGLFYSGEGISMPHNPPSSRIAAKDLKLRYHGSEHFCLVHVIDPAVVDFCCLKWLQDLPATPEESSLGPTRSAIFRMQLRFV